MAGRRFSRKGRWAALGAALLLGLVACSSSPDESPAEQAPTPPTPRTTPSTTPPAAIPAPSEDSNQTIAGTIVHFTAGDVVVEAVIEEDNPTTRSFLAMLPMTLTFSDFGGKEKVASPTGELDFTDAEGLNPEAGDLFSYIPWGNVGFFYDTDGNTFSSSLTKIGSTTDIDRILLLDGREVTIDIAN